MRHSGLGKHFLTPTPQPANAAAAAAAARRSRSSCPFLPTGRFQVCLLYVPKRAVRRGRSRPKKLGQNALSNTNVALQWSIQRPGLEAFLLRVENTLALSPLPRVKAELFQ
ncbi:unnamed protein product [Coccothraustes coccothraustes]